MERVRSEKETLEFLVSTRAQLVQKIMEVYKAIQSKVEKAGGIKQWMFNRALASGKKNSDRGNVGARGIWNMALSQVQGLLGGRMKAMITGSAPLSPDIQEFVQTCFKSPVRQGYGLTETCGGSCCALWEDNSPKQVGPPLSCCTIRLADWEEGNYRNSDRTKPGVGMPRGEVLIGGPSVCQGYYVDEDDPDEEVRAKNTSDFVTINGVRYFRTGDVGQITPAGCLMIIDRKKDLWKGPQGEYVALTKVEAALKLSMYVDIPMCYGKTGGEFPVALVCVREAEVRSWAESQSIEDLSPAALKSNPRVVAEVFRSCNEACKASKLAAFEVPKKLALCFGPDGGPAWTPENDLLTAAMKLKRPQIVAAFKDDIDAMYASA
jgi:long-subunit acyl-CoA synthetase (AMP-forming)